MTQSYPLALPTLRLTIVGQDRTQYLLARTLQIRHFLGSQGDTCRFVIKQPETWRQNIASIKPGEGQEVLVEVQTGSGGFVEIFGGLINRVAEKRVATGVTRWEVECIDYTALLTRRMVRGIYRGQISDIVTDIITMYAPRVRLSTLYVEVSDQETAGIAFNYRYPKDCLDELAGLIGWDWYIDADKFLHFQAPSATVHPSSQTITNTSNNFMDLSIEPQLDQVRNRIWVQGGQSLSDFVTELFIADGVEQTWHLKNTAITEITMTIDGMTRSIAAQGGTNAEDVWDFLYAQNNVGGTTVTKSANTDPVQDLQRIVFRYRYKYPINVMVEDTDSQAAVAALSTNYAGIVLDIDDDTDTLPVGYWKLAEIGGATLTVDSSGNGNNGLYNNFVAADQGRMGVVLGDPANTAVFFDGTNNYIQVPHAAALNLGGGVFGQPFCVALWVRHDPGDTTPGTYRTLLNKGTHYEVRVNYLGQQVVSLHSSDYGSLPTGAIDLGNTSTNNTGILLPDSDWHLIVWAYTNDGLGTSALRGVRDGFVWFLRAGFLQINNGGDIQDLYIGSRDAFTLFYQGQLDEISLWNNLNINTNQIRRLYDAAQEDGIREAQIVQNDLSLVAEARALGNLELAKWADVITALSWSSFVPGWQVGDTVTVNVTSAITGHTFSGTAKIQSVSISALGNQRLQYQVECSASRFSLIDFYTQLLQQDHVIPGTEGSDIAYIATVDDSFQMILVDGPVTATNLGTTFRVAPDWGAGTTPYIATEFWVVDPNAF